jgi:Holliday junction resolvase RusA-like endonuclease
VQVSMALDCAVPQSWSGKKQRAALAGEIRPTSKPDIDNVVKAIFDGLNGVAWRDDVQVVSLTVRKHYSATPRVDVHLSEASVMPRQQELAA